MQAIRVLFDLPSFSVSYDSDEQWLYVAWREKHNTISSLASFSLLRRFILTVGVHKLLCDSRQALDGWDELGHWISHHYLPALAHLGIGSIAWVNAEDWATREEILPVLRATSQPSIVVFEHLDGACEWLRNTSFLCGNITHSLP